MKTPEALLWPSAWKTKFRRQLLRWYSEHGRDLPWRRNRDPYFVWISEIMLQQTQVATVEGYFQRFIAQFPTIQALAAADEQQVLRLWEGLGYYRRARQLHQAAQVLVEQHGGTFPRDPAQILALPGIGRYTAGAISSIAFDLQQPILEANTIRLLSRLLAYRDDPTTTAGQKLLWQAAAEILPSQRAGDFNQALMDLGSLLCTPREPRCLLCPVQQLCAAHQQGLQAVVPVPKKRPEFQDVRHSVVIVYQQQKVLLLLQDAQRTGAGRWGGLWDFPRFELPLQTGLADEAHLQDQVQQLTGLEVECQIPFHTLKHGVTRYRITLECRLGEVAGGKFRYSEALPKAAVRWLNPEELADYPLNTTGRKIARLLQKLPQF